MARATRSFESKLQLALDSRTGKLLAQMSGMAACAGIGADSGQKINDVRFQVYKARINHYGGSIKETRTRYEQAGHKGKGYTRKVVVARQNRIPERHFIDVPLKDTWFKRQFERAVADVLKGGRARTYQTIEKARERDTSASLTQFGGPYSTLLAIARELASAQIDAIYAATPPNKDSTAKRKGKNTPLRDTEEMMDSIKGWVER